MKEIFWIFGYFFIHLIAAAPLSDGNSSAEIPKPVLKATTIISVFNATFSWKIENFHLFDFGTKDTKAKIVGPTLTAIDQTNNNKLYTTDFSILPEWTSHFEDYHLPRTYTLEKYEISCEFHTPLVTSEYHYKINGTIYDGNTIQKSHLNEKGTVEISVKAFYYTTNKTKHSTFLSSSPIFDSKPNTLGEDLLKWSKKDLNSHFVIDCGGEEITAYKPIMQVRSAIFNEALSNGTDRIRITDFSPKIVKKVVEFCNNDSIENFDGEETNIFTMAYAYKIPSLITYSSKEITENANTENAVARFKFAHFYHEEALKKWFFEYIIQNFVEISKSETFKSLDAELYKPILEELLKQKKII